MHHVGAVIIGRNEGERLHRCLHSVIGTVKEVVYVDSGSSDDSVAFAESVGAHVVSLDMSKPFTAARARNAGFEKMHEVDPELWCVMFIDGDCVVNDKWFEAALPRIRGQEGISVILGRQTERHPERSIYNQLCDMEWHVPIGDCNSCAGCALIRITDFVGAGKFRDDMIAGEEPEMCVRIRMNGGRIVCIDAPMTTHDAAMSRLGQYLRRAERAGHAYAEGMSIHGAKPWRHNVKQSRSILIWAMVLPMILIGTLIWGWWNPWAWISAGILILIYIVQWWRIYFHRRRRDDPPSHSALYASFVLIAKFPQLRGMFSFWINRLRGRKRGLIEYK